jgi:micrococcal nuclease
MAQTGPRAKRDAATRAHIPAGAQAPEIVQNNLPGRGKAKMRILWMMAAAVAAGSAAYGAAPSCAGEAEISGARIMRVERNAALILTDGRALHLEGIRLPDAAEDHAPQAITEQAFAALNALARGKLLTAYAIWPKEDRYDRVRAQVFAADGTWLQRALLQKGLARVQIAPDRGECYRELYAAEAEARKAGLGLWADPAYAFRSPGNVAAAAGSFQIVVGRVLSTTAREGRVYLNFGNDWRKDFTVSVAPDDRKTFTRMGVDPLNYQGKLIRVRGMVQMLDGPEMDVGNPKEIELLQ